MTPGETPCLESLTPTPNSTFRRPMKSLGWLQFTDIALLSARNEPGQRAGSRQDRHRAHRQASRRSAWHWRQFPSIVERGVVIREFAAKITPQTIAIPDGVSAGTGAGRVWLQRLLLSFSGYRDGPPRLAVRIVHDQFGVSVRRRPDRCHLFRSRHCPTKREIRHLATTLYERADWHWACDGGLSLTHGWRPESGFIPYRWRGYDEGLLLYILGLGLADPPVAPAELCRLHRNLRMEENLRPRAAVFRSALYASALAYVGGFSRHPR